jgi:hypothetical protein
MADNLSTIQTVTLSISRIVYYTDLQRADVAAIPLGVMAEITGGGCRGLGLIARTHLLQSESELVGRLIRERLSCPFNYLEIEFNWALENTESGTAMKALASRHSESFFFSPPVTTSWRKALAEDGLEQHLVSQLCKERDREFYVLLAETPTDLGRHPGLRRIEESAAA